MDILNYIQACVSCFLFSLIISPFIISLIKREKVKQVILHYVDNHQSKAGTPTMGGIIFLIAIGVMGFVFLTAGHTLASVTILVFLAYGINGFLDDFIKFKFKRNLGLKAYQKIIFQLAIAGAVAYFVYTSNLVGSTLYLPFSNKTIDVGFWIIPITIIVLLACTNSVNLTDGLDGLAASTVMCYMLSFIFLLLVMLQTRLVSNISTILELEYKNMIILSCVVVGAMLCFLLFNCFPAKIFMGDTGSLALGSLVACMCLFTRTTLFIPILGIMFVLSAVSVIIQVAYYKLTRKRVFLMAPLHHHFERKGVFEGRIVVCYAIITSVVGLVTVLCELLF